MRTSVIRFWLILTIKACVSLSAFSQGTDTSLVADSAGIGQRIKADTFEMETWDLVLHETDPAALVLSHERDGTARLSVNGSSQFVEIRDGRGSLSVEADERGSLFVLKSAEAYRIVHVAKRSDGTLRMVRIPKWLSIVPPLIAIALALIFKEVIVSLFVGIWSGAFIAGGMRIESLYYTALSFMDTVTHYIVQALADAGHLSVIIFSLLIGGMVAIISKNGGMAGVVRGLSRHATSARSSQFLTWLMGVAIFFDDYANTLIVGSTMRSVTDRFRISREKLAYIVDSTAAPVAAVAFITTWIGAELGYIDDGLSGLRDFPFEITPYAVFIGSLKYSFYPILTLSFILILVYLGKDYGPMLSAEKRARSKGQVSSALTEAEDEPDMEDLAPVPGAPLRWYNAVIPVAVVILMTMYGLLDTGMSATYVALTDGGVTPPAHTWGAIWGAMDLPGSDPGFLFKLGQLIGNADPYIALLWASLSGALTAIILTVGARIMRLFDTMHYLVTGFKTMMPALIILTLAWGLAITTHELQTADYISSMLSGSVSPYLIPAIVFVLAASIAFSTGSSWSTMAILYPIAIPTTWAVCMAGNLEASLSLEILLNVIATVLAASVLGDHCSPISDTTILSSLASDCNHIDHVRTQLPYALTVGSVSLCAGTVATLVGGGWGISALVGALSLVVLFTIIRQLGRKPEVE